MIDKEKSAEFYDKHTRLLSIPLEQSPWLKVYKTAAGFIPDKDKEINIIDLGCGSGRFARLLFQMGYRNYLGVDFSIELVKEARQYVAEYEFLNENVFSQVVLDKFPQFDVFVLLEILEHINEDLNILSKIPAGRRVVISVPNYMSKTHVRAFNNIDEIIDRYGQILEFEHYELGLKSKKLLNHYPPNSKKLVKMHTKIFVCDCIKK